MFSVPFRRSASIAAVLVALLITTVTAQDCVPAVAEPVCSLTRFVGSTASSSLLDASRLGAGLSQPADAAHVPSRGWLLIVDSLNHAVRVVDLTTGMRYSFNSLVCTLAYALFSCLLISSQPCGFGCGHGCLPACRPFGCWPSCAAISLCGLNHTTYIVSLFHENVCIIAISGG